MLTAAGIAAGTLLARRLERVNVLVLGAWQFLLGGVVLAVAAAVVEGPPTVVVWTGRFATVLLALALGTTAVPYLLWFTELRRARRTSVTAWTLLTPVVGVVLGVLVLGEAVTVLTGIGDAIVIAALVLVAYSARIADRRPPLQPTRGKRPALARRGNPLTYVESLNISVRARRTTEGAPQRSLDVRVIAVGVAAGWRGCPVPGVSTGALVAVAVELAPQWSLCCSRRDPRGRARHAHRRRAGPLAVG